VTQLTVFVKVHVLLSSLVHEALVSGNFYLQKPLMTKRQILRYSRLSSII